MAILSAKEIIALNVCPNSFMAPRLMKGSGGKGGSKMITDLKTSKCFYNGQLRCWSPASEPLSSFWVSFPFKKAKEEAGKLGFKSSQLAKIGNRFNVVWGIRIDLRDNDFLLAVQE